MAATKSNEVTTSSPTVNWSSFLVQLLREYETPPAKGLPHGLQKDAIQNGWGARDGKKKFRFEIVLHKNARPKPLLTLTDAGTVGLIGDVLDSKTLPDQLPPDQRLAKFESMFEPGEEHGPGLFGRGKLIFNAASHNGLIYYDSLTKNGKYRFNIRGIQGRQFQHFQRVLEGDNAVREIENRMNHFLPRLSEPGTRITIVNPRREVVDSIESGAFLGAIEETWWEIIRKYGAQLSVRVDDGAPQVAAVPADYGSLPMEDQKGWKVYYRENIPVDIDKKSYRIKRLHMLVPPRGSKLGEDLLGISVHRKGMKVGTLGPSVVPKEIEDRFFGYVELESGFEDLIADLENITHYGFASLHKAPYRNLKREVQNHFDTFLERLGLKKKGHDPEEQMRRALEDAQAELNSILRDLGVPSFGSGREPKADFLVSVEDLAFPSGSNYLHTGDRIGGFWFCVKNISGAQRSAWLEVYTYERDVNIIETLQARQRMDVPVDGEHKTKPFSITLVSSIYPPRKKIACICKITDSERKEVARKAFYFHLDLDPKDGDQPATIRLLAAKWPRPHSRRVDFGEEIGDLRYEVENLSGTVMKTRVRLRTLWAAEGNSPIDDRLGSWDIELSPFQSKELIADRIVISKDKYEEVGKGKLNLRCHAVGLESASGWEKGARLAEHTVSFFLNTDPSLGFFEDTETFQGGPNSARSEAQPLGSKSWKLRLNTTHPAYEAIKDEEERVKVYCFEEMAKQTVYVLVRTDQFKVLQKQLELGSAGGLSELAHEEVLDKVAYRFADKVLASYYSG